MQIQVSYPVHFAVALAFDAQRKITNLYAGANVDEALKAAESRPKGTIGAVYRNLQPFKQFREVKGQEFQPLNGVAVSVAPTPVAAEHADSKKKHSK